MDPSSRNPRGIRGLYEGVYGRFFGSTPQSAPSRADAGPGRGLSPARPMEPESPALRASEAQLQARKMIERPSAPSGRLPVNRPKAAFNPGSPATPGPNLFRASVANNNTSRFTFSPRVPPHTMKESFPAATPGRSYHSSASEITGRGMSKTTSHELFNMRIPSPDPVKFSGEAISKQVPQDSNRAGSIYADEYLAHLCPPSFNDLQRRQFFCVLDLRRLKYAADDIFAKKDWKLNVTNFAKEFEKSRSLIMLRYGLYEFKSIKPSDDVVKKWKADHNIPESEEGDDSPKASANPRTNGTYGILSRGGAGKRKADDDDLSAAAKRTRPAERAPLAETTATPANSKTNKRRFVDFEKARVDDDEEEENLPRKMAKSSTPSATKSKFESIANKSQLNGASSLGGSPAKSVFGTSSSMSGPSAIPTSNLFSAAVARAGAEKEAAEKAAAEKAAAEKMSDSAAPAKSVFEGGIGFGSAQTSTTKNIFGSLSNATSSAGSGNENAAADTESETDSEHEEEESEARASHSEEPSAAASGGAATPQAGPSLFAMKPGLSAFSANSSDAEGSVSAPSLFDRIKKGSDGRPVRMMSEEAGPEPSAKRPMFGSARAASPEKQDGAAPAIKTWNPDTPIKFAGGASQPGALFGSAAAKPASLFAPKETTSSTPSLFGAAASEPKAPEASNDSSKPTASSLFGAAGKTTSAPAESRGASLFGSTDKTGSGSNMFSASATSFGQPKDAEKEKTPAPAAGSTPSLFGTQAKDSVPAAAPATPALFSTKPQDSVLSSQTLFGNAGKAEAKPQASVLASQTLFGNAGKAEAKPQASVLSSQTLFGNAGKAEAKQAEPPTGNLFGAASKSSETESKTPSAPSSLFGNNASTPGASLFGMNTPKPTSNLFGAAATGMDSAKPAGGASQPSLFGKTNGETTKPLFGANNSFANGNTQTDKTPVALEPKNLFGVASNTTSGAAPLFGHAGQTESAKPQASLFGNASIDQNKSQPSLFGTSADQSKPLSTTFGNTSNTPGSTFNFGSQQNASQPTVSTSFGSDGGQSAGSSFTFTAGGKDSQATFNNPFAAGGMNGASGSNPFNFTSGSASSQLSSAPFQFGSNTGSAPVTSAPSFGAPTPTPTFPFGGDSQPAAPSFGGAPQGGADGAPIFSFGGSSQQDGGSHNMFSPQPSGGSSIFGNLAPPVGGTSTGTSK